MYTTLPWSLIAETSPAKDAIYRQSGQRTIIISDACTRDLTAIQKQNEQDTCIVAENPGHFKRTKNIVVAEDHDNLKKELADQR